MRLIASIVSYLLLLSFLSFQSASYAFTYNVTGSHSEGSSDNAKKSISRLNEFAQEYLLNIEVLESQEGPYSDRVAQELLSLGMLYQNHGKHQQAIEAFKRSLHLKRINEGLYNLGQVPIVEKLIDSFLAQQNWRSADDRFKYLNWLYQRNYENDAIELYPFTMQMANWHLKSFSLNRLKEPALDLLKSYYGYMQAVDILTKAYGPNDLRLISSIRGSLLVNYLIATSNLRYNDLEVSDNGQVSGGVNGIITKMGHLKNRSLKQGVILINQEIDIYAAQPEVDYHLVTASKLKLADWFLMYGRRETAMEHYQKAYQYMTEHINDGQVIEQTFARTVVLPNFENMKLSASVVLSDTKPNTDVDYIHASLDVTRFGTAKNVKIIDSNLTSNATRTRVLRTIRKAKYRPIIADGNVIASAQVQLHIVP